MALSPPPERRPAELMLLAHRAHAAHHELLPSDQLVRLGEVAASVADTSPAGAADTPTPRRRRSK